MSEATKQDEKEASNCETSDVKRLVMREQSRAVSNIVELPVIDKYEVQYVFDDGKVVAVTHPLWQFRIMRSDDKIAMVCEETDELFGELDRDVFNTMLVCWLLIDDPNLVDGVNIEWTDVNLLLPENDTNIIGCCDDDVFECHHFDDGAFEDGAGKAIRVCFWKPMPGPQCVDA